MTKSFTINYNGKDETIEVEDHPRAGVMMKILRSTLKFKAGQSLPEPDFEEYVIGLATSLITKAPWTLQNPDAIRSLPWGTYQKLCELLGDEFPLEGFLFPVGKLMYGKKLETSASTSESTTSLPSSGLPSGK